MEPHLKRTKRSHPLPRVLANAGNSESVLSGTLTKGQQLAEVLERIRQKQVCAYMPGHFCDCKFGADRIGEHSESGNGCPEMRDAIHLLRNMTDLEFRRISGRKCCTTHFFQGTVM